MKKNRLLKVGIVLAATLGISAIAMPQLKEVIKVVGVGAAVQRFGGQINSAFNRLMKHEDTAAATTRVVPIISVGINSRNAIGAAQVLGPRKQVDQVRAVAQLEADLFGREIRIRGLIPVASDRDLSNIKRVENVGVSGIVDLRL